MESIVVGEEKFPAMGILEGRSVTAFCSIRSGAAGIISFRRARHEERKRCKGVSPVAGPRSAPLGKVAEECSLPGQARTLGEGQLEIIRRCRPRNVIPARFWRESSVFLWDCRALDPRQKSAGMTNRQCRWMNRRCRWVLFLCPTPWWMPSGPVKASGLPPGGRGVRSCMDRSRRCPGAGPRTSSPGLKPRGHGRGVPVKSSWNKT